MESKQQQFLIGVGTVLLIVAGVVLGNLLGSRIFIRGDDSSVLGELSTTVNPYAVIAGSGSPLPSDAKEDVVVNLSYLESDEVLPGVEFRVDYPNSWEATVEDPEGLVVIRKIGAEFFVYDNEENNWLAVVEDFVNEVIQTDGVLLTEEDFDNFATNATQLEDEACGDSNCAVWQAEVANSGEILTMRVSNTSRKIIDIVGSDVSGTFVISYTYRDVTLKIPEVI